MLRQSGSVILFLLMMFCVAACSRNGQKFTPGVYQMGIPALGMVDSIRIGQDLKWEHTVEINKAKGSESFKENGVALLTRGGSGGILNDTIRFDDFSIGYDIAFPIEKARSATVPKCKNVIMFFESDVDGKVILIRNSEYGYIYKISQ